MLLITFLFHIIYLILWTEICPSPVWNHLDNKSEAAFRISCAIGKQVWWWCQAVPQMISGWQEARAKMALLSNTAHPTLLVLGASRSEQKQRGQQLKNDLLWKVPEFCCVCFYSVHCVYLWVYSGSHGKLWAMEHNSLSENAFRENLGGESSHVIECFKPYCLDGNLLSYYPKF